MSQMQGWINSRGSRSSSVHARVDGRRGWHCEEMRSRMMMTIVEAFWLRLHAVVSLFAEKLAAVDPALVRELGRTPNDTFLLRGHLAFKIGSDGDELAFTVDIQNDGQQITITSDACTDHGRVVVAGP